MTDDDLKRWRDTVRAKALARVPERPRPAPVGRRAMWPTCTPRSTRPTLTASGSPASSRTPAGCSPRCTAPRTGPCANTPASALPRESNERYRYLLSQGTTGLSVAFDLPTQMGYDSDDEMALGEVGRVGVAIDSIEDMRVLLDGLPLDQVSTSMTINATASTLSLCTSRWPSERGIDPSGAARHRPERRAQGVHRPRAPTSTRRGRACGSSPTCSGGVPSTPPRGTPSHQRATTSAKRAAPRPRSWRSPSPTASPTSRRRCSAGLEVDTFAPRLSFFFNAHNNLLEEVAKFRAARRLWATLMRDRFGATQARSMRMRFHTQTGGSTLDGSAQIDNNVVRVTLQALAAVLGGTQSLHTNGKDEALALPTAESARLALRTQQVIAHETGVADFVDPLGGSWAVERLTDELEAEARCASSARSMVWAAWWRRSKPVSRNARSRTRRTPPNWRFERQEEVVVGVNRFPEDEEGCSVARAKS